MWKLCPIKRIIQVGPQTSYVYCNRQNFMVDFHIIHSLDLNRYMIKDKGYLPIEDYGLIGNLNTTALISKMGSIDFLPFTRFDDPTIFAALLDNEKGGSFSISIRDKDINHKQLYLPDTAILITRYFTDEGIAELTDFMPLEEREGGFVLVRKLKVIKGEHTFHIELRPGFNYGANGFVVKEEKGQLIVYDQNNEQNGFRLISNVPFKKKENGLTAVERLGAKQEICFVMLELKDHKNADKAKDLDYYIKTCFNSTARFWHEWVSKSRYNGRWEDIVNRSAITLKLLTSHHYGSTVAAATLGLPERVGGDRNWDYRFTWIRDAAFTMYTFIQLGYTREASKFIEWIQQRSREVSAADELMLMYRVDGSTDLGEEIIPHLEGYKGSRPVRKGNGASSQFQLDIFGELIDTIYIYNKNSEPITYDFWMSLIKFIDFVCDSWKEKDSGIWEVRSNKKEFLFSKVMSWVAVDRGILIAEDRSFPAPLEKWRKTRDEIFNDVFNNYWNEDRKAFVQYRGSTSLDASALLIPLVRMMSPKEPRWISTLKALEEDLITDSLVYRYRIDEGADDGFLDLEGTFSMCSFWYIECLAKSGEMDKAILCFEKMLGYSNHLGLFSEQISLKGELLGNFPQAFTHLALISAALQLRLLIDQENMLKTPKISN